jgi:isopentenyl phosphate kinase
LDRVDETVVIKLGGSVITHKDRPLSLRIKALDQLSKVMAHHYSKKIIVHGGGSFGHYYAKKAGLSTECKEIVNIEGVYLTRKSMFDLDQKIVGSLSSRGIKPYTIAPFFVRGNSIAMKSFFLDLLNQGLTPVLFGDVIPCHGGFKILSGDDIAYSVCSMIKPTRMIFCMDVDGVYPSSKMKGDAICELDSRTVKNFVGTSKKYDVTGGITRKLKIALKISKLGTDVFFVNGLKPHVVFKALNGVIGMGTYMRGRR